MTAMITPHELRRVSAHWKERDPKHAGTGSAARPPVIILIKFNAAVMQRQAHIESLKRG